MNYLELAVTLPADAAESVAWALTECGLPGVFIEECRPEESPSTTTVLKAYVPEVTDTMSLGDMRQAIVEALAFTDAAATFEVSTRSIPEEDWATSWQQYWHVQRIGERLVVKPSWEDYAPEPTDVVITLDPKQAFGTGTHPTTRLCMRLLERVASKGPLGSAFDVGTGSGILAVAACLLGSPEALGVDTDPVAVAAAAENAEINGVADRACFEIGSAADLDGQAAIVFANILAEVVIELAGELFAHTSPGGKLIASGIIARKADEVAGELQRVGYVIESQELESDWVGILASRP